MTNDEDDDMISRVEFLLLNLVDNEKHENDNLLL